jgi:hypothetical protein
MSASLAEKDLASFVCLFTAHADHSYARPSAVLPVDVELDNSASDQQPPDVDLETLQQLKEQLEGAHVQILELKGQLGRVHMCIQQQKEQLQSREEEMSCLKKQVKEQEDKLKTLSYDPDSFDDQTVQFYLGLKSKCAFDALYHHLQDKASRMHYWRGENGDSNLIISQLPARLADDAGCRTGKGKY